LITNYSNIYIGGEYTDKISYESQRFPYRNFCYLPQPLVEQQLLKILDDDEKIIDESEVINISKIDEKYIVTLKSKNKNNYNILCDYLIGCDGNNSIVRNWLNMDSIFEDYGSSFLLYDVKTKNELTVEANYYLNNNGYIIIAPIAKCRYRIIISTQKSESDVFNDRCSDFLINTIKVKCNINISINELIWFTKAKFYNRISVSCRKDNCFLVGDAFHVFSPVGGLNMNAGIGDALNLAWKLAYVIKGYSPTTILETYVTERTTVVNKIKKITEFLTSEVINYNCSNRLKSNFMKRNFKSFSRDLLAYKLSGYNNLLDKDEGCIIPSMFKVGHHISEFIKDRKIYAKLCSTIDNIKYSFITSRSFISEENSDINISCYVIPELKLYDKFILLRPDGYILKNSNITYYSLLNSYCFLNS